MTTDTKSAAALLGARGGQSRSEKKIAAARANGRRNKPRSRTRAEILRLHAEGVKQAEIARQVDVTRGYVSRVIKKATGQEAERRDRAA